uniref:Uncharacterized protein n=1 Tax=Corvus moneduloides TaxID=1196302 RepID=A0A8C3DMP1_CORMO
MAGSVPKGSLDGTGGSPCVGGVPEGAGTGGLRTVARVPHSPACLVPAARGSAMDEPRPHGELGVPVPRGGPGGARHRPPRQPRGFWTFEYYQAFFDVDTRQVLERIKASVLPVPGKNFVRHRLRNNPDLYVPVAVTLIFSYAGLVPLGLWGALSWARGGSGGSFSLLETLCAYGYSLAVLLGSPQVLWALPVPWLRWAVLAVLAVPSAAALAVTFWPPLRAGGRVPALAGGAALVALHTLLALGCQLYFFEPLPTAGSGGAPVGIPPSNASHPAR